jgi:hypothetical protein
VEEGQKTVRATVFPTTALMENRHGLVVQGDLSRPPLGSMLRLRLPVA